jgi:hypothetical protein
VGRKCPIPFSCAQRADFEDLACFLLVLIDPEIEQSLDFELGLDWMFDWFDFLNLVHQA